MAEAPQRHTQLPIDVAGMPRGVVAHLTGFDNPLGRWRRLFSEALGTFFLVLVAAGGPMVDKFLPGSVSHVAAVVAPGIRVMAMIMFMCASLYARIDGGSDGLGAMSSIILWISAVLVP